MQFILFLYIVIFSYISYKKLPLFFNKTGLNFFKKASLSVMIFLAMIPWILLLALFGFYLSYKFDIKTESHIITDYITKNTLNFSSLYLIIYAVIGAPFFEEFIFRGFIYDTLKKKWGILTGIFVTSLLFSLFHMNFLQFFYIFGLGTALALVYEATSNLWYPIMLHALNNLFSIVLTLLMKQG